MTDKKKDPVEMWHDMLGQVEQGFNSFANKAMGSEDFSRVVHQVSGASLGAKKSMGDVMERYLASMNLPSRAELTNIGERLQAIEARLNEIMAILNRAHADPSAPAGTMTGAPRPPRTKRPPSASGAKT
jgi:SMC interacting uncharacterized protein involved in chromosome segregation